MRNLMYQYYNITIFWLTFHVFLNPSPEETKFHLRRNIISASDSCSVLAYSYDQVRTYSALLEDLNSQNK